MVLRRDEEADLSRRCIFDVCPRTPAQVPPLTFTTVSPVVVGAGLLFSWLTFLCVGVSKRG